MRENVKIPLSLLNQTIDLLENIDISRYQHPIPTEYENILCDLHKKKQSLALRQTYAKVIFARDEDKRFDARMQYLQEKRNIADGIGF